MKDPEEIVDHVAFKQYQVLANSKPLKEGRIHICSDNTELDFNQFGHIIRKKIAHLKDDEKEAIEKKMSAYCSLRNKANLLKRKALGGTLGRQSRSFDIFEEKKEEIVALFGKMFSVQEVYNIICTEWKLECKIEDLKAFRKAHLETINVQIEQYKREFSSVRLAQKRSRLEELSMLYSQHKLKYNQTQSGSDLKYLRELLEQIRKEVEGDKFTIDGNIDISVEQTITHHIHNELLKNISLKEMIIGRVAARAKLPAARMIELLNNSYYAQLSSYSTVDKSTQLNKPYPSEITYEFDFDKLNQTFVNNQLLLEQALKQDDGSIIQSIEPIQEESNKAKLFKILAAKQSAVHKAKNMVQFEEIKKRQENG